MNFLLKRVAAIRIPEKREELGAAIESLGGTPFYKGDGRWDVAGPGMERQGDGLFSWTDGRWELQESGLTVTPINSEAATLLEFLNSWQLAVPTPVPTNTPTPSCDFVHLFIGKAFIDGQPAPMGTLIAAYSDGYVLGSTTAGNGGEYYPLLVNCPPSDGILSFKVGPLTASQTLIWEAGGADILNLTAFPETPRLQPTPTATPIPLGGTSSCSPTIESQINGDFEGWDGETVFVLTNGQIWQQAEFNYMYSYRYRPRVIIFSTIGGCEMQVEGIDRTIRVQRLN